MLPDLFLDKPNKKYQKSFESYTEAYKKAGDDHYFNLYKRSLENFDEYLKCLENYSKGLDLQQGYVATSTFWLIDNNEVAGVTRIRHQEVEYAGHIGYDISPAYRSKGYGTKILKLALGEAAKLGLKEIIVTCITDNIHSKKVIENNNGKLLGVVFDPEENEKLYKYIIKMLV